MIAQEDRDLFPWLVGANAHAGQFLKSLTDAGLRADPDNYGRLRPVLLELKEKYPSYGEEEHRRMVADGYEG